MPTVIEEVQRKKQAVVAVGVSTCGQPKRRRHLRSQQQRYSRRNAFYPGRHAARQRRRHWWKVGGTDNVCSIQQVPEPEDDSGCGGQYQYVQLR
jgi:hypothetical protein